ncbi:unnamed protein product [Arabidopsis arenosa]|uniref:Uncharacterized protein n=1 Tax=Arabidopsis arenosa TaxID=38785 RepID=A0A8S1ZP59_ARAAE|nr:unnamed protein product [Arabidopsis arenosa]
MNSRLPRASASKARPQNFTPAVLTAFSITKTLEKTMSHNKVSNGSAKPETHRTPPLPTTVAAPLSSNGDPPPSSSAPERCHHQRAAGEERKTIQFTISRRDSKSKARRSRSGAVLKLRYHLAHSLREPTAKSDLKLSASNSTLCREREKKQKEQREKGRNAKGPAPVLWKPPNAGDGRICKMGG